MDFLQTRPAAKLQPNVVGLKARTTDLRCLRGQPFQLSTAQSVRRIARRPCLMQLRASAAEQDVKTSNDFKVRHSVSDNSFEVKGDIKKIFQYAADFSHISRWDSGTLCHYFEKPLKAPRLKCLQLPGTTGSKLRESDSRPAFKVGDTVALMTVLFGVKSSTV